MKIFIDIGHPAHVHYFRNFIRIMQNNGHDFFVSARNKEVTQALLKKYSIPFFDRGKGSITLIGKALYLIKADYCVYQKAREFSPDLFLSFASPYAAQISKILNRPHVSFTDTENAKLGILSFVPFTECILTPSSFQGDFKRKHIRFDGFMELCYLHPNYYVPDKSVLSQLNLVENEPFAFLRFVSWTASHDRGNSGIPDKVKNVIISELQKKMHVFISSEGEIPNELAKLRINISPEKIHDVLALSSVYIGEGATMASECAMLGTPALYVNSLDAGTLRELEDKYGLVKGFRSTKNLLDEIKKLTDLPALKKTFQEKQKKLLSDKIDVTAFMVWFIENYPESFRIMKANPNFQSRFR